jgi:Pyruvate/2-oxoacid:ferredoxin oxidoreductase delta subunit
MMKQNRTSDRFDERDTIFSRMSLIPGTDRYKEYYSRYPEREEHDCHLRSPKKGVFSGKEPEVSTVQSLFSFIKQLRDLVSGKPNSVKSEFPPEQNTKEVEQLARSLGAADFGISFSRKEFFYSVRGRGKNYGKTVTGILPNTIVMAFEMDREKTASAPSVTETAEVARVYLEAAKTAIALRHFIDMHGYRAVAHIDGESKLVMPPLGEAAGIGAIGRHGLLVHPKLGSRIRLSAVTTDMPLVISPASSFRIKQFCDDCRACADYCPKQAVPSGKSRGEDGWGQVNHEACYEGWRDFGSDCGVCLAVCPFSGSGKGDSKKNQPGAEGFLKGLMYSGRKNGKR